MTPRPLIWRRVREGVLFLVMAGVGVALGREASKEVIADIGLCVFLAVAICALLCWWSKEDNDR